MICNNLLVLLGPEKSEEKKPSWAEKKKKGYFFSGKNHSFLAGDNFINGKLFPIEFQAHTLSTWAVHIPAHDGY